MADSQKNQAETMNSQENQAVTMDSQENQAEVMNFQENQAEMVDSQENQTQQEPTYRDCVGPQSSHVKLIGADGREFIIRRDHAEHSKTIKTMLSGPGEVAKDEMNEIRFQEIPSRVLERVCDYLAYKARYTNSTRTVPEFVIEPQIALELLMAANFLDC